MNGVIRVVSAVSLFGYVWAPVQVFKDSGWYLGADITEKVLQYHSDFQKIEVYRADRLGSILVLDDVVQLTSWDNFAYHEMMAHVPLMNHPAPRRVLIIGGGDGGTLSEVVKHGDIQEIVLCEIDPAVVYIARQIFPEYSDGFADPRVTVIHQDAIQYIRDKHDYFDIICVDSSDPVGPGVGLFNDQFYGDVYRALTRDGIVVAQGESLWLHRDWICQQMARNRSLFPITGYYYTLVPTYPSGMIGFFYAAKQYGAHTHRQINKAVPEGLRYYSGDVHDASFVLPTSWTV